MRTRLTWTAAGLFLGALLVSACGGSGSGDPMEESMAAAVTAFGDQVHAIEHLVLDHGVAVAAAADLAAVATEESNEATKAMAIHHEMDSLMGHMAMCMSNDAPPNTDAMALEIDDLGKEIAAHMKAMDGAADMDAAKTEEARHQKAIEGIVIDMYAEHDAMAKMAGDYMCPMEDM